MNKTYTIDGVLVRLYSQGGTVQVRASYGEVMRVSYVAGYGRKGCYTIAQKAAQNLLSSLRVELKKNLYGRRIA